MLYWLDSHLVGYELRSNPSSFKFLDQPMYSFLQIQKPRLRFQQEMMDKIDEDLVIF